MAKAPNQQQQDLYAFIVQHAPIPATAHFQTCQIASALSLDHLVAYADIGPSGINATLIVSLPEHSNQVYIAITDHFHPAFCELVARFDAESESNDAVEIHSSIRLRNPFFNQVGWHAILFAHVAELIENFPETAKINNEHYVFKLITCLTQNEFEFAQRRGSIALLQELYRQRRNFLKFIQPNWNFISDKTLAAEPADTVSYEPTNEIHLTQRNSYSRAIRAAIQQQKAGYSAQTPAIPQDSQLIQAVEFVVAQVLSSLGIEAKTENAGKPRPTKGFKFLPVSDKMFMMGEIILGTSLLVGGIVVGLLLLKTRFPAASIFPGIFATAGIVTLIGAYLSRKN